MTIGKLVRSEPLERHRDGFLAALRAAILFHHLAASFCTASFERAASHRTDLFHQIIAWCGFSAEVDKVDLNRSGINVRRDFHFDNFARRVDGTLHDRCGGANLRDL